MLQPLRNSVLQLLFAVVLAALLSACGKQNGQTTSGSVVFISERDGNAEVYTMKPDGTEIKRITTTNSDESNPVWSPDGKYIAYRTQENGNGDLGVYDTETGEVAIITDNPLSEAYDIAWTSDSLNLVFTSWRENGQQIYIVGKDGENLKQVTNIPGDKTSLDISFDNQYVAFSWYPPNAGKSHVATFNLQTLKQHDLGEGWGPRWSPDGKHIVFASRRDGREKFYISTADGTEIRVLADSIGRVLSFRWSPDGKRIAFASYRGEEPCPESCAPDIHVLEVGTGEIQSITKNILGDVTPEWTPDAKNILFVQQMTDVFLFGFIRTGNSEIFLANIEKNEVQRVTRARGADSEINISAR